MLDGQNLWERFDDSLAPYAQHHGQSRGRQYPENPDRDRLPFQRDRDRIIHTTAFRRLRGKMQVVSPDRGDHFRNRLTHTVEVAQVARDLARSLRLNEDLAEAVALAHDLGHPPFGHAGERALDRKMAEHGGSFDHNLQSLRVVEVYERRYADFLGLNLTFEVLEGLQKHVRYFERGEGQSVIFPHLESQLVDVSDEIAYLSADLEDGLRAKAFSLEDLQEFRLCKPVLSEAVVLGKLGRSSFIRGVMRHLLADLVTATKVRLAEYNIKTLEQAQQTPFSLVDFSQSTKEDFLDLKQFLLEKYYRLPSLQAQTAAGEAKISAVFDYLMSHPESIPQEFMPEENLAQRVCDYLAGMTDRFLEEAYERIV